MTDETIETSSRSRRIKCFTKKPIYLVPGEADLGGDPKLVKKAPAGKAVLLTDLQYQHFQRNGCVTKDVPEDAEFAEGFE